jgi:hypothetical protein
MQFGRRLRLFLNVLLMVAVLVVAKLAMHHFRLEFLTLDTLFSSIVASTIFIIGFLLTSTLPDYKEAEKLPAEIRVALEAIHDDVQSVARRDPQTDLHRLRALLVDVVEAIERGLGHAGHHSHLEDAIAHADVLAPFITEMESRGLANNYVVRIRGELDALRRCLFRISYIQKIEFVPSAQVLIQSLVGAVLLLLLCLKTDGSWGTSLIFGFVSYLFVFALHLIAVFKQPFRQGEHSVDKVSLYLLRDFASKLSQEQTTLSAAQAADGRVRSQAT